MANKNIPYDGYPAPGAAATRLDWAGDHFGPAAYPPGGYNLNFTALGFYGGIEELRFADRAQSGNWYARAYYPANASGPNEKRAIPAPYVTIKWFAANGTEANNNNLSAEVIRMFAQGI